MSTTYTPNVKLAMPGPGDPNWNVAINGNCTSIDGQAPVGGLAVSIKEVPSAALSVAIAGGNYLKQDGTIATFAGVSSQAMGASTTNYLYLDLTNSGTMVVNTSGFPITAHVRLAVVGTGSGTVTSIVDSRVAFEVVGSILDGTQWTVGTSSASRSERRVLKSWGSSVGPRPFSPRWVPRPPAPAIHRRNKQCSKLSTTPSGPSG